MKVRFFWQNWPVSERRLIQIILVVAAVALCLLVSNSGVLTGGTRVPWDVLTILNDIAIPANLLDFGTLKFTIDAPSAYVVEQYVAPLMLPEEKLSVIFLLIACFGLSVVLASLTTLSRFWYLGGVGIFTLLLVFSRTEVLVPVSGMPGQLVLLLALLLYGGAGYYLHAFRPDIGTVGRILCFLGMTFVLGIVVGTLVTTSRPFYTLLVYSLPLWLIPTIIFFVVCATEVIYGLVWLTTSRATGMGRRAFPNLLLILLVYLVILVFAFVANTRLADWGIVMVPAYLLGGAAALIGLTGFRLRCESTEGQLPFRESGVWLYVGLMLIAMGTVGMGIAASNDPLLEVLEDTIVNSQLGMGGAFVFYIAANFIPLLRQGLPVHKVLYKPLNFSLVKARVIGVALVVGLFSMQNLFPLKQGIAAYFNGLGDLHTLTGEYVLAEQYYNTSLQQEFQNHKGNYALASLARRQGDNNAAVFYFRQATLKKPSPQAYVGLANLLAQDNLYFEAMFSLREGGRTFPNDPAIVNNLGVLYSRTSLVDSAYYFLSAAEKLTRDRIPRTNMLAVMARVPDQEMLDSLARSYSRTSDVSEEANRLVISNLAQHYENEAGLKQPVADDSLLSASGYAYWLNFAYNQARLDSLLPKKLIQLVEKNNLVSDDLILAAAHADFYAGNKTSALETVLSLAAGEGKDTPLYHKILGHWFLQLGLYDQAIEAFKVVDDPEGVVGHAIAQTLAGNPVAGTIVLEKLNALGGDPDETAAFAASLTALKPPVDPIRDKLKQAQQSGEEADFLEVLRTNPYHPDAVRSYVAFIDEQKGDVLKAYSAVVRALRFNDRSAQLWGEYALLNIELGLLDQAEEGRSKVEQLAGDTDYHDFYRRYQAKSTFKQKERDAFR